MPGSGGSDPGGAPAAEEEEEAAEAEGKTDDRSAAPIEDEDAEEIGKETP